MKPLDLRFLLVLPTLLVGCAVSADSDPSGEEGVSTNEDALTGCLIQNWKPWLSGGRVYSRTRLWCPTTHKKLYVSNYLVRNNVGVAEDHETCFTDYECNAYSSASNPAGNQQWCTVGAGVVDGPPVGSGTPIGGTKVCETSVW